MPLNQSFANFASGSAKLSGRPLTFAFAVAFIMIWGVLGPLFHYSDTWQLVVNTVSSIVTFAMVFLIQNTQTRDTEAVHAKLDELINATKADRALIGIERLTDQEIERFRKNRRYGTAAIDFGET